MSDSNKKFSLPIAPCLENSTQWWLDQNPREEWHNHNDRYDLYVEWMRDQGVVIKTLIEMRKLMLETLFDTHKHEWTLDFVDSDSMMIFVLRWG
jgi:hypothetical protein